MVTRGASRRASALDHSSLPEQQQSFLLNRISPTSADPFARTHVRFRPRLGGARPAGEPKGIGRESEGSPDPDQPASWASRRTTADSSDRNLLAGRVYALGADRCYHVWARCGEEEEVPVAVHRGRTRDQHRLLGCRNRCPRRPNRRIPRTVIRDRAGYPSASTSPECWPRGRRST